jgi:acetyl esterase/lipase
MQARARDEETSLYGSKASIIGSFSKPPGNDVVMDYLADKDGQLAFAITVNHGMYALFRLEGDHWEKCPVDLDKVSPVDAGDRKNELIVVGPRTEGKPRALQRLDAATGVLGEVVLQDKAYDPMDCAIYRHPVTRTMLGVRYSRSLYQTAWFDPNYADVQKMLTGKFPGQIVQIMGSDQAENRFFIGAYSDRQPVSYSILDIKAKSLALIEESAPWIDPKRMQPTNVMKIKTRDGHQFDAYLTLPAGASKANPPPLVVLPHGGPWTRDSWGFDGDVQFLASRGYAVLQPNYRGSTGYGWMYSSDDNWAFRKMHDDVTDAVKTLVKAGLVDPSRLAIMGTSFGGYLAMCGAAFEPDLYRCAITISGVFDWEQAIREKKYDQYDTGVYGILLRNLGNPKVSRDEFDRISPLRHIDMVKIPVFVAHGKDDEVAAVEESRALIAQLGANHVPFESLLVSGEGHGMSNVENQVELYTRVEAFLDKYLKPAQPVAAR